MNQICSFLLAFLFLVSACDNSKSGDKTGDTKNDEDTAKTNITKTNDPADDIEKKKEELSAMTPLTSEQLEKLAPSELMGAPSSELSSNFNLGTGMASAIYLMENNADMRLTILDCGGPGGAGIYGTSYADLLNHDTDDAEEYTKTIDFNGGKALEHCTKGTGYCSITWFTGNRFLVSLEGSDKDIIRQASKGLSIK